MLCVSLFGSVSGTKTKKKKKHRGVGKRRERRERRESGERERGERIVSLLERCWLPSFSHSSWAVVHHVAGLAAEGVVATTVGHAC